MGKKEKLYKKAKTSPANFRFSDLCFLAESVGFVFRNQSGSHKIYKHATLKGMMNFQSDKGKAKKIQIRRLLDFIDEHKLIRGEGDV